MRYESVTTKASVFVYSLMVPQFESHDEAEELVEGGREGITEILNSDMNQNAKQSPKKPVRERVEEAVEAGFDAETLTQAQEEFDSFEEPDSEEALNYLSELPDEVSAVITEVVDARETARNYVIGRPRGSGDGLTKTASREIGAQLRDRMGDDELASLAEEHGIDIEDL